MSKTNAKTKVVDGILPSDEWLRENGYTELVKSMQENPELFKHLPQEGKAVTEAPKK